MKKSIVFLLLFAGFANSSYAATWLKLQESKHAILKLDKTSVLEVGKYKRAWVKLAYKATQTNLAYPEKTYNNAKLLWFFDCAKQQSATSQVYQFLGEELIDSAAIDVKKARFLEPVPETEIDVAMRYVCKPPKPKNLAKPVAPKVPVNASSKLTEPEQDKKQQTEKVATNETPKPAEKEAKKDKVESSADNAKESKEMTDKEKADDKKETDEEQGKHKKSKKKKRKKHGKKKHGDDEHPEEHEKHSKYESTEDKKPDDPNAEWAYKGKKGPEFWSTLSTAYETCESGKNQSPIDIDKAVDAELKPLKTFQRFPVSEMINDGKTIQANFKSGNMVGVDGVLFQMRQVNFHTPSEHTISGNPYPLEAQFMHEDPHGNLAFISVLFEEGAENKVLAKILKQLPKKSKKPSAFKGKVVASDFMPLKKEYYRFTGSMTMPPCTEGAVWLVMKSTLTASKKQIDLFKRKIRRGNSRPVQALNGRVVLE